MEALLELDMPLKKFVYLSSLSVYGAIKEGQPYEEISEQDTPRPNTAYGQSKLEAERLLESYGTKLPYVILRPTGVYGPRERDYYLMARSIQRHVDFALRGRCRASRIPGIGARAGWQEVFPHRRECIPKQYIQRPVADGFGQSVVDKDYRATMAPAYRDLCQWSINQDYGKAQYAEQRQIPYTETAQLAM